MKKIFEKIQKWINGDIEYYQTEPSPKPYRRENPGSHVTLEYPISGDDLYGKLFNSVTLYGFGERDKIYLQMPPKHERNRRIFFNNYILTPDNILIGIYPYANFMSPEPSARAFAAALAERIKSLEDQHGFK